MSGAEERGAGEEDVTEQGQHGYKEERRHEMCFCDTKDEIDFSLL